VANTSKEIEERLKNAARPVRDPVPGELEPDDAHDRHSGYSGLAHGNHNSRNAHPQGSGSTVEPMRPGANGG
jgi:hypothetical protein